MSCFAAGLPGVRVCAKVAVAGSAIVIAKMIVPSFIFHLSIELTLQRPQHLSCSQRGGFQMTMNDVLSLGFYSDCGHRSGKVPKDVG